MAEFTVEFARGTLPPPEYDDSLKNENIQCGDDLHIRTIMFNNNSADFNVGKNFTSNYPPETNIRIEGFSDIFEIEEIAGGIITTPAGFIPSQIKNIVTNQLLTYPYTLPISQLSNLSFKHYVGEMDFCDSSKFKNRRTRKISYMIEDSNNLFGPVREAVLITIGTS